MKLGQFAHNRPFLLLVTGQFVSRAGDGLWAVGALLIILDLSGNNPITTGFALALDIVPYLLFGFLGGVLVDRWDRRTMMMLADIERGVVLVLAALLLASGSLTLWHMVVAMLLVSSLGRLFTPARQALIPDLVEKDDLVRANAVLEGSGQAAMILGLSSAGFLAALWGNQVLLLLDAATFFISALSVVGLRVHAARAARPPTTLWQDSRGGLAVVRDWRLLRLMLLLSVVGAMTFQPVPLLLPLLVRGEMGSGAREYGLLSACFFAGSVAGSAIIGKIGAKLHRGRAMLVGFALLAAGVIGLGLAPWAAVAGAALLTIGGAASVYNIAEFSLLQQLTKPELRGRVIALANLSGQAARPVALLLAAGVSSQLGTRVSLLTMSTFALIAVFCGGLTKEVRDQR